jgi:hypothetical protein
MRAYMKGLFGQELRTPVQRKRNVLLGFDGSRVIVATDDNEDGARVSLSLFQNTVERVYAGEEVIFNPRNRSALLGAVLETMDEVEVLANPRRARLRSGVTRLRELDALVLPDDLVEQAEEGGIVLRQHRARERDAAIVRAKKEQVKAETGRLACEGCDLDFGERYGLLGDGFIECHHTLALAAGTRTTGLSDLAIVCPNCHRMIHRTRPMLTIEQVRELLRS